MIQGRCTFRFPIRLTITKQISKVIHIRGIQDAALFIHEAILEKGILKIKPEDLPREGICRA
jgi:hypothetical protein